MIAHQSADLNVKVASKTRYMQKLHNIPANYHFFESLVNWLRETFPDNLSEVKILLPNRRSCREITEILSQENCILPKIKTISDLSYEDFFDLVSKDPNANSEKKEIIDELLKIKCLDELEYLFFLTEELKKISLFWDNSKQEIEFHHALKLAQKFQEVLSDIERNEVDLEKIAEVDDSDLAMHRQINLDFVRKFHNQIRNSLLKNAALPRENYQNLVTDKFINYLKKHGTETPIVIAGSTGSLEKTRKLIAQIHQHKNGHVVLHGYNHRIAAEETHAQFFLTKLIEEIGAEQKISDICYKNLLLSSENRQNFIDLMLSEQKNTINWQNPGQIIDKNALKDDFSLNFKIVESKNKISEARNITKILQNYQNDQKIALIANDNELTEFVKLELRKNNIEFNDTRDQKISKQNIIQFLLLICDLIENNFNSHSLLALLKNELCYYSRNSELIKKFEIEILRQSRTDLTSVGIKKYLKKIDDIELQIFFDEFLTHLKPIIKITESRLSDVLDAVIQSCENLTKQSWNSLISQEEFFEEVSELFSAIKKHGNNKIKFGNFANSLRILFDRISYFKKSSSALPIQILSNIEARLLNHDLVIISGLNDGIFPAKSSEDWLGKKIKKDLGIDIDKRRYGQSAYDFANYLSNKSIILTRSIAQNGQETSPSPFLLKLSTLSQKLEIDPENNKLEFWEEIPKRIYSSAPNAKTPYKLRPKKYSITEISRLIANPYVIYAKKILQLKELNKIDYKASYKEFGSFVHKVLEEFVKNPTTSSFEVKIEEIFEEYFVEEEAKMIWLPKFLRIFAIFQDLNQKQNAFQNYSEIPVKLTFGDKIISGIIDRISIDENGNVTIIDYKTGTIATKKDVKIGKDPQLTLAALALIEGIINHDLKNLSEEKISELNYWKLSPNSAKIEQMNDDKNNQIHEMIEATKAGIQTLFDYFNNEENGFVATNDDKKTEYDNLIRRQEWE